MEIPADLIYGLFGALFGGFGVQIGIQLVAYGKLKQQVLDNSKETQAVKAELGKEIVAIKDRLNDGYTCAFHAEFKKEVGEIVGELKTRREARE